ncbi:MAG: hypothetical protein HYZ73_05075 [Elusimicrobia bacterium]|nr:hypothetical protein [Elusimicrobiota bacterium]
MWMVLLGISSLAGTARLASGAQEPFFPIGLMLVDDYTPRDPKDPPSKITVLEEFPEIARVGFNVIRVGRFDFGGITPDGTPPEWGNTDANARVLLDTAQKSGLKVLMGLSYADWIMGKDLSNDQLNLILKRVRVLKDHPALWGWVLNDDTPQGGIQKEGEGLEPDPEKLRKVRRAIKEVDPSHPLVVGLPGVVDQNYEYRDIADIYELDNLVIGFEVIPPGFPQEWEAHPEDVGKRVDLVYNVIGPKQKVIADVQTYNMANDSLSWGGPPGDPKRLPDNLGRYPTIAEMRFMAYDALIHKSQGVFFNCYRWDYQNYGRDDGEGGDDVSLRGNPSQWEAVSSVSKELKAMTPILLAPTQEPKKAGVTIKGPIELLIKHHQGRTYLLTVNPSPEPVQRQIRVARDRFPNPTVTLLPQRQRISFERGSLDVQWSPYEVRVYEIVPGGS